MKQYERLLNIIIQKLLSYYLNILTLKDPSIENNILIREASRDGNIDVVKLLLADKRVNPSANDNEAIQWAKYYGHTEVVKLLLEHVKEL